MSIKGVTLSKEFKKGLPNYSNITVGVSVTWEIQEGEEFEFDRAWDMINRELSQQSSDTDQSWVQGKEYKNHYQTVIKTPKV